MPSNVEILTRAIKILADHGVKVEPVPGWQTRNGSRSRTLAPEAVVVHHTGDPSTPLSLIRDGRANLPGPLANFLVGQSGRIYLVAAGYSNNAGYGGRDNFALAKAGRLQAQARPPASDGTWSANGHGWAIEGDGRAEWPPVVRANVVKVAAALHLAHGWPEVRVIGHKELTRRKPIDPAEDMGQVRAEVLAQIKAWNTEPPKEPAVPDPVNLKVLSYNIQAKRWGGGRYIDDANWIDDIGPSIAFCQETEDIAVGQIEKVTGFDSYVHRFVSLFSDGAKWARGEKFTVSFGTTYHGLVGAKLTRRNNGLAVAAASVHIRPTAAFANPDDVGPGKRADIAAVIEALAKWQKVVVGGDWNTPACKELMEAAGYTLVTPWEPTHESGWVLDAIFVRGLEDRTGGSIVPSPHSDHHGLVANLTIPAPVPST